MLSFLAKSQPKATWNRYAAVIPTAHANVRTETQGGVTRLHVPYAVASPWFARIFSSQAFAEVEKKIELDRVGAFVWQLIDGERTLEAIRIELAAEFKMRPVESQIALAQFVDDLFARNLITTKSA